MSDRLGYDLPHRPRPSALDSFGLHLWTDDDSHDKSLPTTSPPATDTSPSLNICKSPEKPAGRTPHRRRRDDDDTRNKRRAERPLTAPTTPQHGRTASESQSTSSLTGPSTTSKSSTVAACGSPGMLAKEPEPGPKSGPVPVVSLLHRGRTILDLVGHSIKQYHSTESSMGEQKVDKVKLHGTPQDSVGHDVDNFWALQSLMAAEGEREEAERRQLIEEIVSVVANSLHKLDGTFQPETQDGNSPTTPPNTVSSSNVTATTGSPKGRQNIRRPPKRKGNSSPPDGDSENEDSGSEENNRTPKVARRATNGSVRFACPYYKRNPQKYMCQRTCIGPGWPSVHRIKEHICRNHKLPKFQCNRCRQEHTSLNELKAHQRSEIPCPLESEEPSEGIDTEQEAKLKSRGKNYRNKSEPEKWRLIYMILFPEDDPKDIPSPYQDYPDTATTGRNDVLDRYQIFLEQRLPDKLRQELEAKLEFELDITQQDVKDKAIDVLESLQRRSLEEFMKREGLSDQLHRLLGQTTTPVKQQRHDISTDEKSSVSTLEDPFFNWNGASFDPHRDIYITEPLPYPGEDVGRLYAGWDVGTVLSDGANGHVRSDEIEAPTKPINIGGVATGLAQEPAFFWPDVSTGDENLTWFLSLPDDTRSW
ncbi:hypothetical protein GGS20DRAFT_186249 [Poronia punctata]|nr:hypothetical protein GGS20DRAFT_186249 [Poronia punctata]